MTFYGLYALQHRGQESAGIATSDGERILVYKDMGLVSQVFTEHDLANLKGHLAIGHTRYSTTGSSSWINAQPTLRPTKYGTLALAHACSMNGFGKVIVLENLPNQCVKIESILEENNLSKYAEVECHDSLQYLNRTNYLFDMGFFDSDTAIRPKECQICFDRNIIRNLAVFHDTSPYRTPHFTLPHLQQKYRSEINELSNKQKVAGIFDCTLSRGFIALWLRD